MAIKGHSTSEGLSSNEGAQNLPFSTKSLCFLLGSFFGLAILKFGNPIILDRLIEAPNGFWEFVFQPWPLRWGYLVFTGLVLGALASAQWKVRTPKWMLVLPGFWLSWQFLSSTHTIDVRLTEATMPHFVACATCFFVGVLFLARTPKLSLFWFPILVAFVLVLWAGFEQHYGGLEATRKMFYAQPDWQQYPAEYIKKIQSNRIFATLVYPNALAAAVLLFAPPLLWFAWSETKRLSGITRAALAGVIAYAALACLYWSGSRSGWLISLVLVMVTLARIPASKKTRIGVLSAILLLGLAGFFVKYVGYFRKGAPSVSARFIYWNAGVRTANENPVLGTGPGTFSASFRRIKPPDAEMAQLAHNDYLEQACDSGWLGFFTYVGFILGSIIMLARSPMVRASPDYFAVWVGLLGWAMQSFVEFLLYIPALAWPAFMLFGWLWERSRRLETRV